MNRVPWLESLIKNLQCRTGVGSVQVYTTDALPERIFVLDGLLGTKSLVLGSQVLETLSGPELEAVIRKLLLDVRQKRWRLPSFLAVLYLPFVAVMTWALAIVRPEPLKILIRFLFAPISLIRDVLIGLMPKQPGLNREIDRLNQFAYDLRTAQAKLQLLTPSTQDSVLEELIMPLEATFVPGGSLQSLFRLKQASKKQNMIVEGH